MIAAKTYDWILSVYGAVGYVLKGKRGRANKNILWTSSLQNGVVHVRHPNKAGLT